ncbi:MAG: toxin-antitoxin system protein [Gemmatimonadetes bacterium]|nr:toxin-antitoxin system protein [Gemmatimonadota bacterium]
MPTTRISDVGLTTLRQLAKELGQPQPAVLDEALENLRRKQFFETLNRQYRALRSGSTAWDEETDERRLWDQTSADGIGMSIPDQLRTLAAR